MRSVRQGSLFSYEDFIEQYGDNARLVMTLGALPDGGLLRWLRRERKGRRDAYPPQVLWRCVIAKFVYQIETYAELIRELRRNGSLRYLVGIESEGAVPQDYHFSRFLGRLSTEEGLKHLEEMFHDLVERLAGAMPGMGKHLCVDATAVHAYSNEQRRHKSDPDAAWSARPKRQRRKRAGKVEEYLDYWFGYLVHLVVDAETELPVGYEVTAANVNDVTRFVPLLEELQEGHLRITERAEVVMADAGYDSRGNCAHVLRELEALPIIKMQRQLKKDEICQAAITRCNELGTPICDSGYKMVYWGRDGDYLKWRCPVRCGRQEQCGAFGRCTASEYGAVLKVSIWEDPRRFPGLSRESRKWKRLYKERTAVERVNARLKDFLLLDDVTIRGIKKVRMHVGLGLLVMLAGAWAMAQEGHLKQVRRTVRLAA